MQIVDIIHKYIEHPYPLWEAETTAVLVQHKWNELKKHGLIDSIEYSTVGFINDFTITVGTQFPITEDLNNIIYLETPSFDCLLEFYDEYGLLPCSEDEIKSNNTLTKIRSAISLFDLVKPMHLCIAELVRSVQVLRQEDAEIDVRYSHPKIPFSIFV